MKNRFARVRRVCLLAMLTLLASIAFVATGCKDENAAFSAPQNIVYNGTTISWDRVDGAEGYVVSINGGTEIKRSLASFNYKNSENAEFSVTVTAVKGKDKEEQRSASTTHTFIPMAAVGALSLSEEGVISWEEVDDPNVYGYEVIVNEGKESESLEAVSALEYSLSAAGEYSVKVRPYADNPTPDTVTYYTSWSQAKSLTILGDVVETSIKYVPEQGALTWTSVNKATGYLLSIETAATSAVSEVVVQGTTYQFNPEETDFTVKVQALGNKTNVFNGINVVDRTFAYLDTVTTRTVEDGILIWDGVEGATGYKVKINRNENNIKEVTECKLGGFNAGTNYEVEILPTSDSDVVFSSWSAPLAFSILNAPVINWNNMGQGGDAMKNLVWDLVPQAVGYTVELTEPEKDAETFDYGATETGFAHAYSTVGEYKLRVKSLAEDNSDTVYDSVYSPYITVTRLASPTPVSSNYIVSMAENLQEGFTATFSPVAKASGFQFYKGTGDALSEYRTMTNSGAQIAFQDGDLADANSTEEKKWTYEVQSLGSNFVSDYNGGGSVVLESLRESDYKFAITVLATPVLPEVKIEGYTYYFGEVNGATGYYVSVDNSGYTSINTEYDMKNFTEGNHTVKVCAKGNGHEVLASTFTPEVKINRLAAPNNPYIALESDGVLRFEEITHANSYNAYIDAENSNFTVNFSQSVISRIKTTGTTMWFETVANYFDKNDANMYYMTSRPSATKTFLRLEAPTDIRFSNTQMMWTAPSNVTSTTFNPNYKIETAQGVTWDCPSGTSTNTSALKDGETYTLKVTAIGSNDVADNGIQYITSEPSLEKSVHKLARPSVSLNASEGKYVWYAVSNAKHYAVQIDGTLAATVTHTAGSAHSYAPSFDEARPSGYVVTISTVGGYEDNGTTYVDSEAKLIKQVTVQLSRPEIELSYSKENVSNDGEIIVNIKSGYVDADKAMGYTYYVGGVAYNLMETTCSVNPNSAGGKVEVSVVANRGKFGADVKADEIAEDGTMPANAVYYTQSQGAYGTVVLLGTPMLSNATLNRDGALNWSPVTNADIYYVSVKVNGGKTYAFETTRGANNIDLGTKLYQEDGTAWSSVNTIEVTICAGHVGTSADTIYVKGATTTQSWTITH